MSLKPLFPSYLDLGVRPALYDDESMTVIESEAEVRKKVSESIIEFNKLEENVKDINNKKLSKEEYLNDIRNVRKIDDNGDFTGSWHGFSHPVESEPGIQNVVNQNSKDIISNAIIFKGIFDGVHDNTDNLKITLSKLKKGENLIIPSGCLIKGVIEVSNLENNNIYCRDLILHNDFIINNSKNINIYGNIKGLGLKSTNIIGLGTEDLPSITVEDPTIFKADTNIAVLDDTKTTGKYWGFINSINDNILNTTTNVIGGSFKSLNIGDTLYSCYNSTITFKKCSNCNVIGNMEVNITYLISNFCSFDGTMLNGQLTYQFSYGGNINLIDSYKSIFYGVFIVSSRGVKFTNINVRYCLFTGLCIKSSHDIEGDNVSFDSCALMDYQAIKNTIPNPTIPNNMNPLLQRDLTCRNIKINNVTSYRCRQGIRINEEVYNHYINNLFNVGGFGNAIVINHNEKLIDKIYFGKIIISNHESDSLEPSTKSNSSIPVLINNAKNVIFDILNISKSNGKETLKADNFNTLTINKLICESNHGQIVMGGTIDDIIINEIKYNGNKGAYSAINIGGTIKKLFMNNIDIDDSSNKITSRIINTSGNIDKIYIKNIYINAPNNSKGIFENHSGTYNSIEKGTINVLTDGISIANGTNIYIDKIITNSNNGINVGANCDYVFATNCTTKTGKLNINVGISHKVVNNNLEI